MADAKITALTENTSPISTDVLPHVDDPSGSPVTKKVTAANLITKAHGLSDGALSIISGVMTSGASSGGTPRFHLTWPFEDIGSTGNLYGFDTNNGGTNSLSEGGLSFNTLTSSGGQAGLTIITPTNNAPVLSIYDKNLEFFFLGVLTSNTSTNHTAYFITANNRPDTAGDITNEHIGFIVDTTILYASNADDSTQTKTDISSGVTLTSNNTYRAVVTSGTNVKFYVNGVLKATHTTNLPAGAMSDKYCFLGIRNDAGVTTSRYARISPITISWDAE